eukprot:1062925_1
MGPTAHPSGVTKAPTLQPSFHPTQGTAQPTAAPTAVTESPTTNTNAPSNSPVTVSPTNDPTQATVQPTAAPTMNRAYWFFNEPKSGYDAAADCANRGSVLATVQNKNDFQAIRTMMNGAGISDADISNTPFWIGLKRNGDVKDEGWRWDDGTGCVNDGVSAAVPYSDGICWNYWSTGQPDNSNNNDKRAVLTLKYDATEGAIWNAGGNDVPQTHELAYACNEGELFSEDLYVLKTTSSFHMYSTSYSEMLGAVKAGSQFEGVIAHLAKPDHDKGKPLYRLYNPSTKDHILTANDDEMKQLNSTGGYKLEGTIGKCFANKDDVGGVTLVPLTRYKGSNGDHCCSTPNHALCASTGSITYTDAIVQCYVLDSETAEPTKSPTPAPVAITNDLIVWNSGNSYFCTTNHAEIPTGWTYKGIIGHMATHLQHPKGKPLYRLLLPSINDYLFTRLDTERTLAKANGYKDEGPIGDCFPTETDDDGVTLVPLIRYSAASGHHCYSTPNHALCDVSIFTSNEGPVCYVAWARRVTPSPTIAELFALDLFAGQVSHQSHVYGTTPAEYMSPAWRYKLGIIGQLATGKYYSPSDPTVAKGLPLFRISYTLTSGPFQGGKRFILSLNEHELKDGTADGLIGYCFEKEDDVPGVELVELHDYYRSGTYDHCYATPGNLLCPDEIETDDTFKDGGIRCLVKAKYEAGPDSVKAVWSLPLITWLRGWRYEKFYSTSSAEIPPAGDAFSGPYKQSGVIGYLADYHPKAKPLHRLHGTTGDYLLTVHESEIHAYIYAYGYTDEGVMGYCFPNQDDLPEPLVPLTRYSALRHAQYDCPSGFGDVTDDTASYCGAEDRDHKCVSRLNCMGSGERDNEWHMDYMDSLYCTYTREIYGCTCACVRNTNIFCYSTPTSTHPSAWKENIAFCPATIKDHYWGKYKTIVKAYSVDGVS